MQTTKTDSKEIENLNRSISIEIDLVIKKTSHNKKPRAKWLH